MRWRFCGSGSFPFVVVRKADVDDNDDGEATQRVICTELEMLNYIVVREVDKASWFFLRKTKYPCNDQKPSQINNATQIIYISLFWYVDICV